MSWHEVAVTKLSRVLGAPTAEETMDRVLRAMGRDVLTSANDLRAFGEQLTKEGGFAGAVGGLLIVHAALYGSGERAGPSE